MGPVIAEASDEALAAESVAGRYIQAMASPRVHAEVAERAGKSAP